MVDAEVAKINGRARAASSVWDRRWPAVSAYLAMQTLGRVPWVAERTSLLLPPSHRLPADAHLRSEKRERKLGESVCQIV
jgi:hypothetical protein